MVRGLNTFKNYFEKYSGNYVIIGGTACDVIIENAGFSPRATKDIDIILIVEALSSGFVKQFWKFIREGDFERREKTESDRKYYRFTKPESKDFPYQIELFSRNPGLFNLEDDAHLTPIPADEDLSSLSAILLDDNYYNFTIEHSSEENGLHCANTEALICLKAKAYLEIDERIKNGSIAENKHLRKHKGDVFRLAVMLSENDSFDLPEKIKIDLQAFVTSVKNDLPGSEIFKEMGLSGISTSVVLNRIVKSFGLED